MVVVGNFEKAVDHSIVAIPPAVLVTEQLEVYADTDINDLLNNYKIVSRIMKVRDLVGWSNLVAMDTTVWQLDPLRASTFHQLPAWIRSTKCVINVKNKDEKCFKYAAVAGLYDTPHNPHRVSSYCEGVPDFSVVTFPVTLRSIGKFEEKKNITVNVNVNVYVYAIDEKECKGTKRKATSEQSSAPKRRGENENVDDEDEDEDEESDTDEDGNLPDLIDDDVSDDDLSMYRVLNNQMVRKWKSKKKKKNKVKNKKKRTILNVEWYTQLELPNNNFLDTWIYY